MKSVTQPDTDGHSVGSIEERKKAFLEAAGALGAEASRDRFDRLLTAVLFGADLPPKRE